MTAKYAFLDTNNFLHYAGLDQIDWLRELKTDHALLVLAPVVIRQLNEKKDSPGSRKLRERADSALKKLTSYSEQQHPITIRKGVELRFQTNDPLVDFATHKLSQTVADDWLIASILEFKNDHSENEVVLVTGDLGLKLKAKNHGIRPHGLSAQYKLPQEEDPDRRRIRELEEEVRTLESHIPRLKLVFQGDATYVQARFIKAPLPTKDSIRKKMEEVRCTCSKIDTAFEIRKQELNGKITITSPEFDNYNARIAQFWIAFEKYLEKEEQYFDARQRLMKVQFSLVNAGSCPATDIDVFLRFPDGMDVLEERELAQPPEMPAPPARPMSPVAKLVGLLLDWNRSPGPGSDTSHSSPSIYSNVSRPTIERSDGCCVRVTVRELKHHFSVPICELYIAFHSWDTVKSFGVGYSLFASNIPQKVENTLHVAVEVQ